MATPLDQVSIRQRRLLDELDRLELDALLINAGPSLAYLTGLDFHLSERPVVAIFRPDGIPVIVAPELEQDRLEDLPFEARTYSYDEDPSTWMKTFHRAAEEARLDYRRVGIEPLRFRVLELRLVEEAAPRAAYLNGEAAVAALRARKDAAEIERMREAVRVAEEALARTLEAVQPGTTEKAVASALTARLLEGGSAPELPFSPIVAFGESSADPHAVPTERPLREGDLILVDWGANVDGYFSDLTRTFTYGTPSDDLARIADLVAQANAAARAAAGPNVRAGEVDAAARSVIEDAGFGPRFIHRTGHGLGREVHEPPYIRAGSDQMLASGMTFTVEPGIYIKGRGGVRIEDDVAVTETGVETLSTLERRLVDLTAESVAP